MPQKLHYITIKGTKDGLVFVLNDTCSFDELLIELQGKLSLDEKHFSESPLMAVKLKTGNRFLSDKQKKQIRDMILAKKNLVVEDFEADVVSKSEAEEMARQRKITSVTQMVRSGQSVEVTGDLLLVGDVNSGATVKATGNIYVMGTLKGTAHAGCLGNTGAVVAASIMQPIQLRIADYISSGSEIVHTGRSMECAFIDQDRDEMTVDRLQSLYQLPSSSMI